MTAGRAARRAAALVVAAVLVASVLAAVGPAADPVADPAAGRYAHAPREDGRYRNLGPFRLPTWGDLADWYWTWWREGGAKPPPGGYASVPVRRTDLAFLKANRVDTTATWVGHATVLLQLAGVNVIADPMFSSHAFFVDFMGPDRKVPVPFAIGDGPRIDVVLISHNHYDHLDAASVDALARQPGGPPLFLVPKGVDAWMRGRGITNVVALDWWDARDLPSANAAGEHLRVTLVPVAHWSGRSPFDRFETLWGGYVVERLPAGATASSDASYRFFFAGDTGYTRTFRELIHARFPRFDFAAIPIGAYQPNRYLHWQHVTPAEAVRIHQDLDVRQSMGIHWGTFVLTTEPFDQLPKGLATARREAGLPDDAFVVFEHGETRVLEHRP